MSVSIQIPSIILPTTWSVGTETEIIDDAAEYTSVEVPTLYLQEKIIHVIATEVIVAGVPAPLWYWVELSPVSSSVSSAYWAAIGGGGGALAPVAPAIEAATGVNGTVHSMTVAWTIHSSYARVVVQTPAPAAAAGWAVQVMISGK